MLRAYKKANLPKGEGIRPHMICLGWTNDLPSLIEFQFVNTLYYFFINLPVPIISKQSRKQVIRLLHFTMFLALFKIECLY